MFTKEQLEKLRNRLPYDSNKRIKAKLFRTSAAVIAEALADPNTKRLDILKAAVEVAEEHEADVIDLSTRILTPVV